MVLTAPPPPPSAPPPQSGPGAVPPPNYANPTARLNALLRQGFIAVLDDEPKRLAMVQAELFKLSAQVTGYIKALPPGAGQEHLPALQKKVDRAGQLFAGSFETALLAQMDHVAQQGRLWLEQGVAGWSPFQAKALVGLTPRTIAAMRTRLLGDDQIPLSERVWRLGTGTSKDLNTLIANAVLVHGQFPDAIALSRMVEAFLLPEEQQRPANLAKLYGPNWGKSASGKLLFRAGPPYAAMRLARTETVHTFHKAVELAAEDLTGCLGVRCVLSKTHGARMPKGDVCDTNASHVPSGDVLTQCQRWGIDPRGVWPTGGAPLEHPNGLCTRHLVLAPPEAIGRIIRDEAEAAQQGAEQAQQATLEAAQEHAALTLLAAAKSQLAQKLEEQAIVEAAKHAQQAAQQQAAAALIAAAQKAMAEQIALEKAAARSLQQVNELAKLAQDQAAKAVAAAAKAKAHVDDKLAQKQAAEEAAALAAANAAKLAAIVAKVKAEAKAYLAQQQAKQADDEWAQAFQQSEKPPPSWPRRPVPRPQRPRKSTTRVRPGKPANAASAPRRGCPRSGRARSTWSPWTNRQSSLTCPWSPALSPRSANSPTR
jgi:hypothetical protein